MRFTLLYDGPLPAQTNHDSRIEYKQRMRREFHRQLVDVWQSKPVLARYYDEFLKLSPQERAATFQTPRPENIMVQSAIGAFNFVPLVFARLWLVCELDILFLRTEPPGSLFTTNKAGDLDNRLKVLFDALRIPQAASELPSGASPASGEDPMLCLLENDNLITAVRLESERLYGAEAQPERVRLVLKVTVKAQQFAWSTIDIAND